MTMKQEFLSNSSGDLHRGRFGLLAGNRAIRGADQELGHWRVVTSRRPEAGVRVIAETHDLPNSLCANGRYDDRARYVVPDPPKAKYTVCVCDEE